MATFLTLAQHLLREIGTGGRLTTLAPDGTELDHVREWIKEAYVTILRYSHWDFLWRECEFIGDGARREFALADASWPAGTAPPLLYDWDTEGFYSSRQGASGMSPMAWIAWEDIRARRRMTMLASSVPWVFSITPDQRVAIETPLGVGCKIRAAFWEWPDVDTQVTNTGEPVIPAQYQMVIVWQGLIFAAAHHAEPDKYQHGEQQRDAILAKMQSRNLPRFALGAPLV